MLKFLTIIVFVGFTSCNQSEIKKDTKTLDFGAFTIKTSRTWKQIKEKGTDSYVGGIAIDDKDTISFDLGW